MAAAGLIVLEVSVGRTATQLDGLQYFAARMLAWHALAGLAEAALTVAIVAALANLSARDSTGCHSLRYDVRQRSTWGPKCRPGRRHKPGHRGPQAARVRAGQRRPRQLSGRARGGRAVGFGRGANRGPDKLAGASAVVQGCQDALAAALPDPRGMLVVLATILSGVIAWGLARTSAGAGVDGEPLAGCS